jgi:hypothetical protein
MHTKITEDRFWFLSNTIFLAKVSHSNRASMNNVEHKENGVFYPPKFFSIKLFSLPWMSKRPLNTKLCPPGQASGYMTAEH